jgi:hypothetical protein
VRSDFILVRLADREASVLKFLYRADLLDGGPDGLISIGMFDSADEALASVAHGPDERRTALGLATAR